MSVNEYLVVSFWLYFNKVLFQVFFHSLPPISSLKIKQRTQVQYLKIKTNKQKTTRIYIIKYPAEHWSTVIGIWCSCWLTDDKIFQHLWLYTINLAARHFQTHNNSYNSRRSGIWISCLEGPTQVFKNKKKKIASQAIIFFIWKININKMRFQHVSKEENWGGIYFQSLWYGRGGWLY